MNLSAIIMHAIAALTLTQVPQDGDPGQTPRVIPSVTYGPAQSALARIDNEGRIVLRNRFTTFEPPIIKNPNGTDSHGFEAHQAIRERIVTEKDIKTILQISGKELVFKELAELLKSERHILFTYQGGVEPIDSQVFKDDTLILMLVPMKSGTIARVPAPEPAVARIDQDGTVIFRRPVTSFELGKVKNPDGSESYEYRPVQSYVARSVKEQHIKKIVDTSGKAIRLKDLTDRLKTEIPVLFTEHEDVDLRDLLMFKDNIPVFCLTPPVTIPVPLSPPIADATVDRPAEGTLSGLNDLLKKEGYTAVPLQRLQSGQLMVRVQIGDRRVSLRLDTGTPETSFDRFRLRDLHLDWNDDARCLLDEITVGSLKVKKLQVATSDMTQTNRHSITVNDPLLDGVLGADVLRALGGVIDHGGAVLYVRAKER